MTKQLDYSRGAKPLYLQIKEYVKDRIEREIYPYESLIPTEPEFENLFGVSRMTVRLAINELQTEGYVKRTRGRGTEVIYRPSIEEELSHVQSFTDEMKNKGLVPGTTYVDVKVVDGLEPTFSGHHVPKELGQKLIELRRVRSADGRIVVFFNSFITFDPAMPLAIDAYKASVYELINARTGRYVSRAEETFEAIPASAEIAKYLKVETGSPILLRLRVSYDQNGKILEYTESFYRGDSYKYNITLLMTKDN